MIFDLETNINHAGFAVHHNFSIMAISLRAKWAGLLKKRPDPFDLPEMGYTVRTALEHLSAVADC